MKRILLIMCCILFAPAIRAQDPVRTDGDKYKVILENDRVRVLDFHDEPGQKTAQHHHPDFVLYVLSPFKRRLTLPDGKTITREFKAGDVIWSKAQTHIGENIGQTETHALIVELKQPLQDSTKTKKQNPEAPEDPSQITSPEPDLASTAQWSRRQGR